MAIKIIDGPSKTFRTECSYCHAIFEYNLDDVSYDHIDCPCCSNIINHRCYGTPVWEGENNETRTC